MGDLSSPVTKGSCVKCLGQLRDQCTNIGKRYMVEPEEQKCRESIGAGSWTVLQRRNLISVQSVAVILKVRLCTCSCWQLEAPLAICFKSVYCEN